MSVLIRGMEMPETCFDCDFHVYHSMGQYVCVATPLLYPMNLANYTDGRKDFCPLIEVQSPHGRLIDADAFATNLKNVSIRQGYKNTLIDEHLSVDDVIDAIIDELTGKALNGFDLNPTIIEAEG